LNKQFQKHLEDVLDFYKSKIPYNEWSGAVIYKVEGNFNDESFTIIPTEIYPISDGSPGYTDYMLAEDAPEVTSYMFESGLLPPDYAWGHIHSHHNMQAYFSQTDDAELAKNTDMYGLYFSMIVNNRYDVVARLSREVILDCKVLLNGENAPTEPFDRTHLPKVSVVYDAIVEREVSQLPLSKRLTKALEKSLGISKKRSNVEFPGLQGKLFNAPSKIQNDYQQIQPNWTNGKGKVSSTVDGLLNAPKANSELVRKDSLYYRQTVEDYIYDCLVQTLVEPVPEESLYFVLDKLDQIESQTFVDFLDSNYGMELLEVNGGFESLSEDIKILLKKHKVKNPHLTKLLLKWKQDL